MHARKASHSIHPILQHPDYNESPLLSPRAMASHNGLPRLKITVLYCSGPSSSAYGRPRVIDPSVLTDQAGDCQKELATYPVATEGANTGKQHLLHVLTL